MDRILLYAMSIVFMSTGAPCRAQNSSDWKRYQQVKKVVTAVSLKERYYEPVKDGDLGGNCNDFTAMSSTNNEGAVADRAFSDIAGKVIFWSAELSALGYPTSVWKPLLDESERKLVEQVSHGASDPDFEVVGNRLVNMSEDYRKANGQRLKPLKYVVAGCGAGGDTEIKFRSDPPGGQISIISEFNYELCKVRGDVKIGGSCTSWRRIKVGALEDVSSSYYVVVRWGAKTTPPIRYELSRSNPGDVVTVGD